MNILSKIDIHPTTYILLLLSTLTGQFRILMYTMILIIIHELGHIICGIIFNFKINKVSILPFGGNIKFDISLNEAPLKEALVTIMGPLFQVLGTLILINMPFITIKEIVEVKNISYSLLIFNLLPIVPLDGSKLLFLTINNFTSYKRSHMYLIYISIVLSIVLVINSNFNFTVQTIIFFLIYKIYEQYKNHNNIINRFILERYLHKESRGRLKILNGNDPKLIWRNRKNVFVYNNKCITEHELLNNYFKSKKSIDNIINNKYN